jgi:hypothetical protein
VVTKAKPDDADGPALLSLYLYYAEQTEKLIERRNATSRYFLTINTGFVAILGLALQHNPTAAAWLVALAVAGIVVCGVWWMLIRSYSILAGAKFEVINEMEQRLPAAPYADEWKRIKESPARKGYTSISNLEALVPWVFAVIYAVLLVASLIVGG